MGRKDIAVALLLALSGPAASEEPVGTGFPVRDIDQEFKKFIRDFGKTYDKLEHEVRRAVFEENLRFVEAENGKGHPYVLGVTEFADMTPDEFALTHLGLRSPRHPWGDLPRLGTHLRGNSSLPAAVDWREKGAVTAVKNQAQCGSCWAFSTTGSLEGAWQLASGKLASMSEQQLVDCSKRYGNDGCSGGLMDNAFKYAERNALCTEESYPYKAKASVCKAKSCTVAMPAGSVKGFKDVKADDEDALKDAVAQQPVSIAIEADKQVFQLYKSGVLSGACGSSLDHGVLVVGYGKANGSNTWIVKNSWGPSWGMDGYALLLRGKSGPGECGLAKQASYPVVKAGPPGPSPGPTPGPVPPPAPSAPHYEKPPCRSDEVEASVEGADGDLCAPSCDSSAVCPMDVPPGTKAKPQCILQDSSSGSKYCALVCMRKSGCPEGATCAKLAGLIGVCVYPETRNGTLHAPKHLAVVGSNDIVV